MQVKDLDLNVVDGFLDALGFHDSMTFNIKKNS